MELSPQAVRATSFKTVKRGYDPDEVDAFREDAAGAIESAQNQAAAMEARARAAVAKLQEVSSQQTAAPREPEPAHPLVASPDDAETISRTLLLAQRTADTTVAEARVEADSILGSARTEATTVIDSARAMSGRLIDEARLEARRAGEDERLRAENEVQALLAKRDFLLSDADHLEQYLGAQRERVRDAAVALHELVERVPGGLGDMRRPILSASAEPDMAPSAVVAHEPEAAAERLAAEPPASEATADESAASEPTPMHLDSLLEFTLDVTSEVPVTARADPQPRDEPRLRIGGDELQ